MEVKLTSLCGKSVRTFISVFEVRYISLLSLSHSLPFRSPNLDVHQCEGEMETDSPPATTIRWKRGEERDSRNYCSNQYVRQSVQHANKCDPNPASYPKPNVFVATVNINGSLGNTTPPLEKHIGRRKTEKHDLRKCHSL